MKLARYGERGREEPAVVLDDGRLIDASGQFNDYDEGFFACGGLDALRAWVDEGCQDGRELDRELVRIGAPVARPSKIVCIGKNYLDHALEFGGELPSEPIVFMKATSAMSGPNDDLCMPPKASKLDYEVELGLVIGKLAKCVREDEAMEYVAGYTTVCDYSERAFQKEHSGQWTKGKSYDGFAPMGPHLVTREEVKNPQELHLFTKVNGELRQNGYTRDMMFKLPFLISYVSQFMTMLPGDVLLTGTPAGVAMGKTPERFLKAGDSIELGIEYLGSIRQRILAC